MDDEDKTVYALDLTNKEKQDDRRRFVTVVDKETGSVTLREIDAQEFSTMTSGSASSADSGIEVSSVNDGGEASTLDGGAKVSVDGVTVAADKPIIAF